MIDCPPVSGFSPDLDDNLIIFHVNSPENPPSVRKKAAQEEGRPRRRFKGTEPEKHIPRLPVGSITAIRSSERPGLPGDGYQCRRSLLP